MKEDYTPAVLAKRKELQEEFKHRRLSGEKVILRYDKIVTLKPREQVTGPPKGKTYNKRFLSESPEDKNNSKALNSAEQSKQVPKKNKPQTITSYLRPSLLNSTPKVFSSSDSQEMPKN
ncbi:unnamed protein product [Arctia plantaginis]|uniref:Uncharacterized protein n=1 Tax=Arctia plantaginis TaxID=874455 RepID=A0A8S0Z9L8_ARCPL|nr:unnamed protein product [Arctia plantaginis]